MLFVYIRLSAFLMAINVIFPSGTPKLFKSAFTIVLSIIIGSLVDTSVVVTNMVDLVRYTVIETMNGLLLGYMVMLCFNVLKFAGSLMDFQMGLSMASMYDNNSETNASLIDRLMYWLGVILFLGINGHHTLIVSIVDSFEYINIGDTVVVNNLGYVLEVFTKLITTGFKIALPFIFTLLMIELLMGLISRSVPSFNVMLIGMPVKMLIGMVLLIVLMPSILDRVLNIMNNIPNILKGTFL